FPSFPTDVRIFCESTQNAVQNGNSTAGGDNNINYSATNVLVLHVPAIVAAALPPFFASKGTYAAGWPSAQNLAAFVGGGTWCPWIPNEPKYAPANILTGFGLFLGAKRASTADFTFTVARVRIDYRP